MSDHTNPPYGGAPRGPHGGPPPQPGQYGGPPQGPPQGPPGGPSSQDPTQVFPQQGPAGPDPTRPLPQQPNPYGPGPHGQQPPSQGGQYGPPPGQYGQQPPPGQYGGQPPGQYGQPPQGQYGQPAPGQYGQPPQGQYGGPPQGGQFGGGQPPYGHPQQVGPEPAKKRGKLIPIIAALAVLMVFGAGGAFAYSRVAGGGGQPAAVLPGNALGYVRVDMKPSAGQQLAALRFLRKFPSVRDGAGLTSDSDDPKQKLFEWIKKTSGDDLENVSYEQDIKPWLGDRAAVAAIPDGEEPAAVVAVQVTDEKKAKAGIDKLFADEDDKPGVAFLDSYAIIAEDQGKADAAVGAAKESSLEKNAAFDKDMDKVGEQGVLSFWVDMKGLAELSGAMNEKQRNALPTGSAAGALRFDDRYVELKAVVRGEASVAPGAANAEDVVTNLPATTAGAIALSDGENIVNKAWEQLQTKGKDAGFDVGEMVNQFGTQYGIKLPDDLKTLLGKNFAVSVDKSVDKSAGLPKVAAKMKTDPGKAEPIVDKLLGLARNQGGLDLQAGKAKDGETLVVATNQAYADEVLKGGKLGDSESFKLAVPDTKDSTMIAYVDIDAVEAMAGELGESLDEPDLKALQSAGMSARVTGTGEGEFSLRVVANG